MRMPAPAVPYSRTEHPVRRLRRRCGGRPRAADQARAALAVALLLLAIALSPSGREVPATTTTVTVERGDTLWDIAEANPVPGLTTEQSVEAIIELNGLRSSMLEPGTRISIPVARPCGVMLAASR